MPSPTSHHENLLPKLRFKIKPKISHHLLLRRLYAILRVQMLQNFQRINPHTALVTKTINATGDSRYHSSGAAGVAARSRCLGGVDTSAVAVIVLLGVQDIRLT